MMLAALTLEVAGDSGEAYPPSPEPRIKPSCRTPCVQAQPSTHRLYDALSVEWGVLQSVRDPRHDG